MGLVRALAGERDRARAMDRTCAGTPRWVVFISRGPTRIDVRRTLTSARQPHAGRLADGYDADVITLDADPLADIGVRADPRRITRVGPGRLVKGAAA